MQDIKVKFIQGIEWNKRTKWELLTNYTSDNGEVIVPTGFITDGASVPRIFRGIFSPTGRYFGAAIIHDYIIVKEEDWPKANHQFEQELIALGIVSWRRFFILAGVKAWAKMLSLLGVNSLAPKE